MIDYRQLARIIVLTAIGIDFMLDDIGLTGIPRHRLPPKFSTWRRYDLFWIGYWGLAGLLLAWSMI